MQTQAHAERRPSRVISRTRVHLVQARHYALFDLDKGLPQSEIDPGWQAVWQKVL